MLWVFKSTKLTDDRGRGNTFYPTGACNVGQGHCVCIKSIPWILEENDSDNLIIL